MVPVAAPETGLVRAEELAQRLLRDRTAKRRTVVGADRTSGRARLGSQDNVVDATEDLLRIADDFRPRPIHLGRVNGRHLMLGPARLELHIRRSPDLHSPLLVNPPHAGGRMHDGVTVIVQNADLFTYFAGVRFAWAG